MSDFFKNLINDCKRKLPLLGRRRDLISNADIEHARIAVEAILDVAIQDKTDVFIVTEKLRSDFYNDNVLVEKVREVLKNERKVEILLLNPTTDLTGNSFAEAIKDNPDTGEIYRVAKEDKKSSHFTLTGDRVFRLETNHEQTKAIISFNNEIIGGSLLNEFKRLKNSPGVVKITA